MLNAPDLQPNAAMNRWIQGILMFDLLKHIPGKDSFGSRCIISKAMGEGEEIVEDDDSVG